MCSDTLEFLSQVGIKAPGAWVACHGDPLQNIPSAVALMEEILPGALWEFGCVVLTDGTPLPADIGDNPAEALCMGILRGYEISRKGSVTEALKL